MPRRSSVQVWAQQVRVPFLVLSLLLALIAGAAAVRDGVFHPVRLGLASVGLVAAHIAVNLLNELSDQATGIDDHTRRTPFSGGTGTLQAGLLERRQVVVAAWGAMATAMAVGAYLTWAAGWLLAGFVVTGALASVLYTRHLHRWGLGELAAGLCLGSLAVMGSYYAQASALPPHVLLLSVPPGLLTSLLLFLNEFPDVEADRRGGRRHLVIVLGHRRAAWLYAGGLALTYSVIAAGVAAARLPAAALLGLLTVPLALRSARIAIRHGAEHDAMVPALATNVIVVLATDALLAVALFVDRAIA
jgi:1,4-dihydroxy-2-naphthoate octaprenyltransferase